MYNFIKRNEQIYVIEEDRFILRRVEIGEIVLNDSYAEIIIKKEVPFYQQVDLFKEVVERFPEIKDNNIEVRFNSMTQQEVFKESSVELELALV